jgi:hypothetical protein
MSLKTEIVDGKGTGQKAKVNREGQLNVIVHPHPPVEEQISALPFRQYFTDNGTSSGSNDMLVDGSTNNVNFYIEAQPDKDIYIKTISIRISDASATLNKFGNLAALANGVRFYWESQDVGEIEIHEGLVSNFDFVRLAIGEPSYGDGTGAFRASNVQGTSEGYVPVIDCADVFGLPYGIRLRKGTTDKLVFTVRDNISTIDAMDIIGLGLTI